jgi:glycosyltransferase involved in cell wall biosynthesis
MQTDCRQILAPKSGDRSMLHRLPDRVVVINDVSVVRGGATSIAKASATYIRGRGIPVTYFTGDAAAGGDADVAYVSVGGKHILEQSPLIAARDGIFNVTAKNELAAWIAQNDTPATIYHVHGWSKILSPSIFGPLQAIEARVVVSAHDFFLVCPNGGYFDFRHEKPCTLRPMSLGCLTCNCDRRNYAHKLWRSARQAARRALTTPGETSVVLAVHEAMIPFLRAGGLTGAKVRALRNPVTPWTTSRVEAERNRKFIFVGRLEQDKGPMLLARAAKRAGVPVEFIGHGPSDNELRSEHPEAALAGWKDREQIAALARDARVLVMPSRYREPFGLVALEALMSGIPIVISDYAMLAEEITSGGYGLACDPHDENGLAAILSRLAGNNALVEAMSRNGFAHARALAPTPEAWADELIGVYSELLTLAALQPNEPELAQMASRGQAGEAISGLLDMPVRG